MDLAAVDQRELQRLVDQLELQLQRDREHRRRIDENVCRREEQLGAMHREVARAEAITSLDDLANSARTVHRATVDRLRLSEATLRSLVDEEQTELDQQRLKAMSFRNRTQGLRERRHEASTRSRELESHVRHFAGVADDLREAVAHCHRVYRDRAAELARWHVAHREATMEDIAVRRRTVEHSIASETAELRDHLLGVVEAKRRELEDREEDLRKVDDVFHAAGDAVQASRHDVDAIAGYEVKRATLRGEGQALDSQIGALEDDASRILWRIEDKEAQIEHARKAHNDADERAVDERLAALVTSAESLQQRRLMIHRRTTAETDLRRQRLGDGEDEAQLRHMLNLMCEERDRFHTERKVWSDQADALAARNATLAAELKATLAEGDELDARAQQTRQELDAERHRIEVAIQETARRTAALLEDLGR